MKGIALPIDKLEKVFTAVEKLSKLQRILIGTVVFLVLAGGFVYFSYMPKFAEIEALDKEANTLKRRLRSAQITARTKPQFEKKMAAARQEFEKAKAALPEQKEIPSLLSSISESGKEAGLEFLLFKPVAESKKEFFAEIPVEMKVLGDFHRVGVFFDKTSRLPRIVNIRDIDMMSIKNSSQLATVCTAVTYRFTQPAPGDKDNPASPKKDGKTK